MFERGALLAERFRVVGPVDSELGLVHADDLAGGRVLLVARPCSLGASDVAQRVEQAARFGLGCPGLARPLAGTIADGQALVAFRLPPSASCVEALEAWPAERVLALLTRITRAVSPLHEQGIGHGSIVGELVFEHGPDVLLGFAVAALARGAAAEAAPSPAGDLLDIQKLAAELLAGRRASAEIARPTPRALGAVVSDALEAAWSVNGELAGFCTAFAQALHERPAADAAPSVPGATSVPSAPLTPPADAAPPRAVSHGGPPPLPPAYAPPPYVPPPTYTRKSSALGPLAAVALVLGLLLMVGGAAGAFAFVLHRAHRAPSTPHAVAAPPAPAPHAAAPLPKSPVQPPSSEPGAGAEADGDEPPARRASPRLPVVPAGVGQSTFPEDARAVLPLRSTDSIWGTRAGAVTWMLFGDLQCPHTRHALLKLAKLKAEFGDDLRLVFRHRPLSEHPYALTAARVLAGVQARHGSGMFYRLLLGLAKDEGELSADSLADELTSAGVSEPLAKLESLGTAPVDADLTLAAAFGVRSTPLSFVNGTRVDGDLPYRQLEGLLIEEQRAADWSLAAGASSAELYTLRASVNLIGVGNAVPARTCVPLGASPWRGARGAPLTIVEFADFECPFCKRLEGTLSTLSARHPGKLRVVWKNFPLPQHAQAQLLGALASEALALGGNDAFWTVHDALLRSSGELDDAALIALGQHAGLDGERLLSAASTAGHDASVRADLALGERLGVNGTPTYFVNGRRLSGALPIAELERVLVEELKTAEHFVASGTAPDKIYDRVCEGSAAAN